MQCIPIRDLKNTAEVSALCKRTAAPIFVTKNGYNDMVIMSAEVYERLRVLSAYEKLMAAERAGVTKVFIPRENLYDLKDVAEEVREKLEIVPADNITDVLQGVGILDRPAAVA